MFWGECDKACCCIEKGFAHCGECPDLPCQKLQELFDDPEHGDRGVRLRNLMHWKAGDSVYEELGNAAQEKAKGPAIKRTRAKGLPHLPKRPGCGILKDKKWPWAAFAARPEMRFQP